MFSFTVKPNAKTFKKYITNAFNYTLRNTTSDWCHNYMLEVLDYTFLELTQAFCKCHREIQNDKQIYTKMKNMK
jgi:hypothetical protein